jgi:hypothetical protein
MSVANGLEVAGQDKVGGSFEMKREDPRAVLQEVREYLAGGRGQPQGSDPATGRRQGRRAEGCA